MRDPRLTWTLGVSALFVVFPFVCRGLAAAFEGGFLVVLFPIALYYMLPASLFGEPWFTSGNFGSYPASLAGHAVAAVLWGVIGAGIGYANGRWHTKRARVEDSRAKEPS